MDIVGAVVGTDQIRDPLLDYFELLTDCDTRISCAKVDLI